MQTVHRRVTVVRISSCSGKKERGKNVCALCLRKEKMAKPGVCTKKRFVLHLPSLTIAFLIRRPTLHRKPTLQLPAVGYARSTPTPSPTPAPTTRLIFGVLGRNPPWRVVCGKAQWGLLSLDLRANGPFSSNDTIPSPATPN